MQIDIVLLPLCFILVLREVIAKLHFSDVVPALWMFLLAFKDLKESLLVQPLFAFFDLSQKRCHEVLDGRSGSLSRLLVSR